METSKSEDCYQISDEDDLVEDEIDLKESSSKQCINQQNELIINSAQFIRGPYERAWTTEATRALIHIRGPMEDKFNEGRQQRTTLWLLVTKQLHKLGFRYSPPKVQKKWHNILITYSKNISKKEESGYVHWEFFEEMYKYLEGRKGTYYRKSLSNDNDNTTGCEESYQFQQYFTESDEPIIDNNINDDDDDDDDVDDDNNNSNNNHIDINYENNLLDEHSNDTPYNNNNNINNNPSKRMKFTINNENPINYNDKLPLEISNVRGGTEMPKLTETKFNNHNNINNKDDNDNSNNNGYDSKWWKDYFERKLQCENDKLKLQKEMHLDVMNFNKMSLIQQEKIERIKIDAINNLTTTLQKLVEVKNVITKSDKIKDKNSI